ncbi:heterokaryon incompatibility protein-domain-containing protein, partial [Paraphoma chrysanthemicola]
MTSEGIGAEVESVCPHFEYKPLPDSSTYIRLLEILDGDFDQHVRCELTTWALSEAPSYAAISYTWGDPGDVAHVTVNGKSLEVRQNCEYVLQQAFSSGQNKYFWCDAISINQGDVAEKSDQVAIFATLYHKADQLLVCVG